MPEDQGVKLSHRAAGRTARAVKLVLDRADRAAQAAEPRPQSIPRDIRYQGVLTSSLAAPTDGWQSPTTATMAVYSPDPEDSSDPRKFIASGVTITVVNRSPGLSADSGTMIKVERINGEWSPTWIDC